jgi:hypothetical protein
MRRLPAVVLAVGGLCLVPAAQAQEADAGPDLEFLEYLGSWQDEDDEWLASEEWRKDNSGQDDEQRDRRRRERAPGGPQGNEDDDGE